jgi:hypothetical protein
LSRAAGQDVNLPDPLTEEARRNHEEELLKKADQTGEPEDLERAIKTAIWRKDFEKARKLADSFKKDEVKAKFLEEINVEEALSLIERKELLEAERLAGKLGKPNNILKTYSALIKMAVAGKNKEQARAFAYEAVRRLKKFDVSTPTSYLISELALATASVDTGLALDLLDELVQSLNRRQPDSDSGEIGFNPQAFVQLSPANEERAQQTARNITDRLQRITALASVYDWKIKELLSSEKSRVKESG